MNEFLANHTDIQEEDETAMEEEVPRQERRDSEHYQLPELDEENKAKLLSCIDEIRGIIGDASVTDKNLVEAIMRFEFDCPKALDFILNNPETASPATPKRVITRSGSDDAPIEKGRQPFAPRGRQLISVLLFFFLFVYLNSICLIDFGKVRFKGWWGAKQPSKVQNTNCGDSNCWKDRLGGTSEPTHQCLDVW